MKKIFAGITIGPITETLGNASSPAALWFGSYLFADLSQRLCEQLENVDGLKIITPSYSAENKEVIHVKDGIGKYPDRIIFTAENRGMNDLQDLKDQLNQIILRVKLESINGFPNEFKRSELDEKKKYETFLKEYLQISYVILTEEDKEKSVEESNVNTNDLLSPYLNMIELMQTFPASNQDNVIKKLMLGEKARRNTYVAESQLYKTVRNGANQLKESDNNTFRSIESVASCRGALDSLMKKSGYFAVVSSDGDSMGKFLRQLEDELFQKYDEACLDYRLQASELVGQFGGMTIYAGGDDLLFLSPVENSYGETVFDLCQNIQVIFNEQMNCFVEGLSDEKQKILKTLLPTVSFGISIQYKKSPLYEALNQAEELLREAKHAEDHNKDEAVDECCGRKKTKQRKSHKSEKNKMAIRLQKHSGQTVGCIVSNKEDVYRVFHSITRPETRMEADETMMHSVIYTLEKYAHFIGVMNGAARQYQESLAAGISMDGQAHQMDINAYEKAWMNLFDNAGQKPAEDYLKEICHLYHDNFVADRKKIMLPAEAAAEIRERQNADSGTSAEISEETQVQDDSIYILTQLLRLSKFFRETSGKNSREGLEAEQTAGNQEMGGSVQ